MSDGHIVTAYGIRGTRPLVYNLYADTLLQTNVIDRSVCRSVRFHRPPLVLTHVRPDRFSRNRRIFTNRLSPPVSGIPWKC